MSPSIQMQRAIAAVKAMKLLGFSQGVAKSVLKELLKVYANNWEYIEAENYRLLADAILDSQDSKNSETNKKEAAVTDELIRPLKRLRRIEDPAPSQSTIEPEFYGETSLKKKIPMASSDGALINFRDSINKPEEAQCSPVRRGASLLPDSLLKNGTTKIGEVTSQHAINFEDPSTSLVHTTQKLTRHTMCSSYQREEQYLSDRAGNAVCYKEPKTEPDSEVLQITAAVSTSTIPDKPMDVIINDISINDNVPIGVVALNGIPSGITTNKDEAGKFSFYRENALHGLTDDSDVQLATNKANDIEYFQVSAQNDHANIQEKLSTNVNIASSNTGKVKLSLTCSFDYQNFKKPSIESIFKIVEDRCLKSYKILHPDFSLMNLMKEICQSAADLAVESGVPQEDVVKVSTQKEYLKSSQSPGIHRRLTRRSFNGSPNLGSFETRRRSMNGLQSSVHIDGESNAKLENCAPESTGNDVSQCLAILPLHEDAIIASLPQHDQYDISKGEERRTISLINEFNSENTPPYFRYISWNAVYQSAHVNFSLAQIGEDECCVNCFGNCLSVFIPCACARETSGEFVYTQDGLLKKKFLDECISMSSMDKHYVYCKNCPIGMFNGEDKSDACKGHPVRKFIKECWSKCGCNKQCGNRVVQRGITRNLQVFYTVDGKGWGLRTLEELPRGAFVCEYVGEILTCRELNDRTVQRCGSANHTYALVLDADWGSEKGLRDEEALCLDATFYGNVGRFVNHRCFDANLVDVPVEWETHDHHYYHLAYFTTRKVEALEELTWDYGVDFKCRAHPIKAFKCLCGSRFCRDSCRSKARMRESSSK